MCSWLMRKGGREGCRAPAFLTTLLLLQGTAIGPQPYPAGTRWVLGWQRRELLSSGNAVHSADSV